MRKPEYLESILEPFRIDRVEPALILHQHQDLRRICEEKGQSALCSRRFENRIIIPSRDK
jgi:hypothetical protein